MRTNTNTTIVSTILAQALPTVGDAHTRQWLDSLITKQFNWFLGPIPPSRAALAPGPGLAALLHSKITCVTVIHTITMLVQPGASLIQ